MLSRMFNTSRYAYAVLLVSALTGCNDEPVPQGPVPSDLSTVPTPVDMSELDLATSATSIDLAVFRAHAIERLQSLGVTDFSSGTIVFVDGAGQIDVPPAFDYGRLYFVVTVPPSLTPDPDYKLAYYAAMQGFDSIVFVKPTPASFLVAGLGGTATLDAAASPAQMQALTNKLKTAHPTSSFTLLDAVKVLTWASTSAIDSTAVSSELSAEPIVKAVEVDGEVYKIDFEFAKPVSLGDGKASKVVDLLSYTSVTKALRAMGVPFTTTPHLPPPF